MSVPCLIGYREALGLVLTHAPAPIVEEVSIERLSSRTLCEPIIATSDHPSFDASAVDGFAICEADRARLEHGEVRVRITGLIAPGRAPGDFRIEHAQTVQTLTGAAVPAGCSAIVMREHAAVAGSVVSLSAPVAMGENIRRQGEEFRRGDTIVPAGSYAHAGVVAAAAMTGGPKWQVAKPPGVALVVTGDELVQVGAEAEDNCVFDTHSHALTAILRQMGIDVTRVLRCSDTEEAVRESIASALRAATVVLSTGGVGGGECDFVRRAFAALGVKEAFAGVRMKPGRPVVFGVVDAAAGPFLFGLPGNPMAALVAFETIVKPFLLKACGRSNTEPQLFAARLVGSVKKRVGVTEFVPVHLASANDNLLATPVAGGRSHMFGGLALANGLATLPENANVVAEGTLVPVRLWGV
ncbi:MAG: molybdopterin molybdotransferase MoeA [Fimbriimonadaceae bacterium]